METIGSSAIWSFLSRGKKAEVVKNSDVRVDDGCRVRSYIDLAKKVAELQFLNREYVLLFRGQNADHKNQQNRTTLKPSIFRPRNGQKSNPGQKTLTERFEQLADAEQLLLEDYSTHGFLGRDRMSKYQGIRWSVLQHYEICGTPLLDVTHSLRIAASFASMSKKSQGYVFAIGVPNLAGAVTANAESGTQTIRLSSVCPPVAVRPHIQEGYLLGEYPDIVAYDQKALYYHYEIDFGRRLIAKFRFDTSSFWHDKNFPRLSEAALYPNSKDPLYGVAQRIRSRLRQVD